MKERTCFLMCPIGPGRSIELRTKIVWPVMHELGFKVNDFLDYKAGTDGIRERMKQWIRDADVCIADLTDNSPNVLFEYGWRLATGLPILPIVEKGRRKELPFDVDEFTTVPYDLDEPESAKDHIKEFVQDPRVAGFKRGHLEPNPERYTQTQEVCRYIEKCIEEDDPPERIDILQCSLLALDPIFPSLRKCPNTLIRLLLMHPKQAKKYGKGHEERVRLVEGILRNTPEVAKREGRSCPNIGLWYYRHEPSVAAVIIDDKLIQLGWYLRVPLPGTTELFLRGHDQPSVLAVGRDAEKLLGPFKQYFESVFRASEPAGGNWGLCIGPRKDLLQSEWEKFNPSFRPSSGLAGAS
jgi:hypothetical protein